MRNSASMSLMHALTILRLLFYSFYFKVIATCELWVIYVKEDSHSIV